MTRILSVRENIRLRPFSERDDLGVAFEWYQDEELVYLVDGVREAYSMEKLKRMYRYLANHGHLYWIEANMDSMWVPIGDVALCDNNLPMVIGHPDFRGKGIGNAVLLTLVAEAREMGKVSLFVPEIYHYNHASQACYESVGFVKSSENSHAASYRLDLLAK